MYWADAGADKIQRANLDGSGIENLVTTGIGNPFGIALDLSAGKIYWTDVVSLRR
jgi:glucose/arabinose dehydrogenase